MKKINTDFSFGELSPKLDGRVDLPYYTKGCSELRNMYVCPQGVAGRIGGTELVGAEGSYVSETDIIVPIYYDDSHKAIIKLTILNGDLWAELYYGDSIITDHISTSWSADRLFETQWVQINKDIILTNPSGKPMKISWNGSTTVTLAGYTTTGTQFTTSGNYPSCCCYFAGRLIFGGTDNNPDKIWASKTLAPTDFDPQNTNDDQSWSTTITTSDYNRVLWIKGKEDGIVVGTTTTETLITGGDNGLTPTALNQTKISTYGSSDTDPIQIGLSTIFVQKDGRRLREIAYTNAEGALASPEISLLAEHLTESGIKRLTYQQSPFEAIFVLRNDRKVVMLSYDRTTGINAWSMLDLGLEVQDITSLDGEIYFLVSQPRPRNPSFIMYTLEKLKDYDADLCLMKESLQYNFQYRTPSHTAVNVEAHALTKTTADGIFAYTSADSKVHHLLTGMKIVLSDSSWPNPPDSIDELYKVEVYDTTTFYLCDLDGNIITDGTDFPASTYFWVVSDKVFLSTINGPDFTSPPDSLYQEGAVVHVFVGDRYLGTRTVDEYGEIDVGEDVISVRVGLAFRSHMKTMRIVQEAIGNPVSRISKVYLRLWKSLGCKIGETFEDSEEITFRDGDLDLGVPELYTGDKEHTLLTGYTNTGYFYVWTDDVYPLNICAMAIDYKSGGQRP